jgi:hypothetical protein
VCHVYHRNGCNQSNDISINLWQFAYNFSLIHNKRLNIVINILIFLTYTSAKLITEAHKAYDTINSIFVRYKFSLIIKLKVFIINFIKTFQSSKEHFHLKKSTFIDQN